MLGQTLVDSKNVFFIKSLKLNFDYSVTYTKRISHRDTLVKRYFNSSSRGKHFGADMKKLFCKKNNFLWHKDAFNGKFLFDGTLWNVKNDFWVWFICSLELYSELNDFKPWWKPYKVTCYDVTIQL